MKLIKNRALIFPFFKGARGVLLSFTFLIFLLSCGPKTTNLPIDSNLKAAFDYLPGSYWIYKDSISGRIDSFYVTNNLFSPATHVNSQQTADYILYNILETNIGNINDTIHYLFSLETNSVGLSYYSNGGVSGNNYGLFTYPFIAGQYFCTQIYSSYLLNGINFTSVAEITHIETGAGGYSDWFYINADVGIIKMRFNHPYDSIKTKIWELQRYHIVK